LVVEWYFSFQGKTQYSVSELIEYGFIRENWSIDELREKRFDNNGIVTGFDGNSNRAKNELLVDVPFAKGVQKWQLPIPLAGFKVIMTLFPPKYSCRITCTPHPRRSCGMRSASRRRQRVYYLQWSKIWPGRLVFYSKRHTL